MSVSQSQELAKGVQRGWLCLKWALAPQCPLQCNLQHRRIHMGKEVWAFLLLALICNSSWCWDSHGCPKPASPYSSGGWGKWDACKCEATLGHDVPPCCFVSKFTQLFLLIALAWWSWLQGRGWKIHSRRMTLNKHMELVDFFSSVASVWCNPFADNCILLLGSLIWKRVQ